MEATSERIKGMTMASSDLLPQHLMLEAGSELRHAVMENDALKEKARN